jgi:UDP:flavonoid glycosyltransferase YjiC (YdhE family)
LANVLFAWELGGNLGHLGYISAFMRLAAAQGHTLGAALKNLRYADLLLSDLDFRCFQAPFRQVYNPRPTPESLSYAHTLEDFCFSNSGELYQRIRAWREIFDAASPDLLYCDYSPGALIASRGLGIPRVALGNGFMTPPAENRNGVFAPYPLTPTDENTREALRSNDARMLAILNAACKRAGIPAFDTLGEIFGQTEGTHLTTLPELDHFAWRDSNDYIGMQPSFGTASPEWPEAGGRRVFCYLQEFPAVQILLDELVEAGLCVLVYTREVPVAMRERFRNTPNIRFISEAISIEKLWDQAHFMVHHGSHGSAIQCLVSGLPQLSIPTQQEQLLTALQLDRAGVGETGRHSAKSFAEEIHALVSNEKYRKRALQFREKYAGYSWEKSEARILADMSRLLGETLTWLIPTNAAVNTASIERPDPATYAVLSAEVD